METTVSSIKDIIMGSCSFMFFQH